MLEKYLVFAYYGYYPEGGWDDFRGSYETLKAAKESLASISGPEWYQIVDSNIGKIILTGAIKHENE